MQWVFQFCCRLSSRHSVVGVWCYSEFKVKNEGLKTDTAAQVCRPAEPKPPRAAAAAKVSRCRWVIPGVQAWAWLYGSKFAQNCRFAYEKMPVKASWFLGLDDCQ